MSLLDDYVGQVLDDKYRLERLLGQGGMGAVYLATHLGTERYVALKLISPQFMRNEEFVQRFQREARAAGRLRHPNVVDVTDFGFAEAQSEPVAYLIMEYLDGCTLGDVLREEKRLPIEWVVDILEQVCSAVQEAHQQGIVHRDLKPENIWLEPNRLGSYRVKVLDFGIAKLAGDSTMESPQSAQEASPDSHDEHKKLPSTPVETLRDSGQLEVATLIYTDGENQEPALNLEAATMIPASREAESTKLFEAKPGAQRVKGDQLVSAVPVDEDDGRTLRFDQATRGMSPLASTLSVGTTNGTALTRVGAIMGTPLYMSPEQCAAKGLDARSDVYSLGVIAYQMLAGEPPFAGDTASIIRGHLQTAPQDIRERSRKLPNRVAKVIMSALSKSPDDRPQTAAAFGTSLRAQAEGLGSLYRRAFALFSEYFPKFMKLSLMAHVPAIIFTGLLIAFQVAMARQPKGMSFGKIVVIGGMCIDGLLLVVSYFLAAATISGVTAVIVTQLKVAPLRPVQLRAAFAVLKRRWRPFLKTALMVTWRVVLGWLLIVPGIIATVRYALYAPVVLMEGLEKKAAMRRARELAARSWKTVVIVVLLQFLIPMIISSLVGAIGIRVGSNLPKQTLAQQIYQQVLGLVKIFILPLMSIVPALLYLKMREVGGETISDTMDPMEEIDAKRSEWQQRMRTRLTVPTARSLRSRSGSNSLQPPISGEQSAASAPK